MTKPIRSQEQNRSLHLGFTQIADTLVENGVSLSVVLQNLDVRPTMESVKAIFRAIAHAKYGHDSTAKLTTDQVDKVWDELIKAVSQTTGIFIPFPSEETRREALESYEQYL